MNRAGITVVKVGGSLLASAEFPRLLRAWLAAETQALVGTHYVLVVGGGKLVDIVREIDARTPLGDERAHWMCVALMEFTAELVSAMLPELCVVASFAELETRVQEPGLTLFSPGQFMKHIEPACVGTKLRHDWTATSDAIAGRLAIVLVADDLVLLKSVPPPLVIDVERRLEEWAHAGYVDDFLPTLITELPNCRCIGLYDPEF